MRMQVTLDSLFARPGSAPIWSGKKESSGTGLAILVSVEAKIPFLDFLEFKALRAQKNYVTFHICLRAICGRKERKIDFSTSAAKFKFYLIFGDICS